MIPKDQLKKLKPKDKKRQDVLNGKSIVRQESLVNRLKGILTGGNVGGSDDDVDWLGDDISCLGDNISFWAIIDCGWAIV